MGKRTNTERGTWDVFGKSVVITAFVLITTLLLSQVTTAAVPVITWDRPTANNEIISGTYQMVVNLTQTTGNITNVSFYITRTTPSGGAKTLIGKNNSLNLTQYRFSFDTKDYQDSGVWTLEAHAFNDTSGALVNQTSNINRTGIFMDNTKSTCSITSPADNSEILPDATISITASNGTLCTIFANNKQLTNMTPTVSTIGSETCSYTLTEGELPEGMYAITALTMDRGSNNISTCDTADGIVVQKQGTPARGRAIQNYLGGTGSGGGASATPQTTKPFDLGDMSNNDMTIGVVIILAGLAYWYWKK